MGRDRPVPELDSEAGGPVLECVAEHVPVCGHVIHTAVNKERRACFGNADPDGCDRLWGSGDAAPCRLECGVQVHAVTCTDEDLELEDGGEG